MRLKPGVVIVYTRICASKCEEFSLTRVNNAVCTVLTGADLMKRSDCTYVAEAGNTFLIFIHCLTVWGSNLWSQEMTVVRIWYGVLKSNLRESIKNQIKPTTIIAIVPLLYSTVPNVSKYSVFLCTDISTNPQKSGETASTASLLPCTKGEGMSRKKVDLLNCTSP